MSRQDAVEAVIGCSPPAGGFLPRPAGDGPLEPLTAT